MNLKNIQIRQMKEQLFREGEVNYVLTNDKLGEIKLHDFLEQESIHQFEKEIKAKFNQCLTSVHGSWLDGLGKGGLAVIFTGGGSSLPMVRKLAKKSITINDNTITMSPGIPIPHWVKDEYPELEQEFPQLAVAIGGSSRNVPILAPQTFSEFGGLDVEGWTIPPSYKGV